jgi:DNA-binding MarR family transcriptional regulator
MASIEEELKSQSMSGVFHKAIVNVIFSGNWLTAQHNQQVLKDVNLTSEQYNVLRILRGQNDHPLSVSGITERMLNRNSNVSRLVDRLLEKELVVRTTCTNDRRQVDVALTPKGRELLQDIDTEHHNWENTRTGLDAQEAQLLSDLLDKMRD